MYVYIYEKETSVCICTAQYYNIAQREKTKKVFLTNFRILLIYSYICEW